MFLQYEIDNEYLDLIGENPSILPIVPEISPLEIQPLWLRQDPVT